MGPEAMLRPCRQGMRNHFPFDRAQPLAPQATIHGMDFLLALGKEHPAWSLPRMLSSVNFSPVDVRWVLEGSNFLCEGSYSDFAKMPSLARKWECRVPIRRRILDQGVFVREPVSTKESEGEKPAKETAGPPLNTEFLQHNTEILYELFSLYGIRPKPTVGLLKKEAGSFLTWLADTPQRHF